jgi:OOP family OmpA-OmpF porin
MGRMNVKQALLAGAILAFPTVAAAQPISGLYIGAGAGVSLPNAQPNKGFGLPPPGGGTFADHDGLHFDTGWVGQASVGYGFGNGLRTELEGDFYRNQLDHVTNLAPANGFENKYGFMANVLYDIDVAQWGVPWVLPYVGVGVGWQHSQYQNIHAGTVPPAELLVNKGVNGFAYQGIVGLAVPVQQVPGLAVTIDYRVMVMPFDRDFHAVVRTAGGGIPGTLKMGTQLDQSVMLGFRYALYTPPPPPPPAPAPVAAPAPAPSRTYLVFFDWDKADLTDRARQIIAEAAQNSTRVQVTRIEVNGYTDASGTPQYNQKLSVKRAQNVAAELVKDGVPENEITVQGFGETHPLVPTAAGVREPQNRRVEIILK